MTSALGRKTLGLLRVAGFAAVGDVMEHRDFRLFITGHSLNLLGLWIYRVALGWLTWELTRSGAWLGAIAAADALPAVLLAPIGGVLADSRDRRRVAMLTQSVMVGLGTVLAVLTLAGAVQIWGLFALTVLRGVNVAFWQPVRLALVPDLVAREEMPTAIAINASLFNSAFFIGPALAGPIILTGGAGTAFAVDAATSLSLLIALMAMRASYRAPRSARSRGIVGDAIIGIRFATRHRGIGPVLLLSLVLGFAVRPLADLLPGFAEVVFEGGAGTLAASTSALGLGSLVGAILTARRGNRGGAVTRALAAGSAAAAAALAFAATNLLPVALVILAAVGLSLTTAGINGQVLVQQTVPDELRGRVLSLLGMILRGAPAVGALAMGSASELVGLRWPVAAGALLGLLVFAIAFRTRAGLTAALEQPERPSAAGGRSSGGIGRGGRAC
ncbi:MAG: MFS transporter [Alphaproteobacteria bacterium]